MKIACDVQLLMEQKKTGIGKMTEYMLESLARHSEDEIYLNYFKPRKKNGCFADVQKFRRYSNVHVNCCQWFYHFIYRRVKKIFPLPYSMFFVRKCDVTQFFNYSIPFGVAGKKAVYVYDMAYRAYPETIQKETLQMLQEELEKACRRADRVITISEFSKQEIIKYLGIEEKKIAVVPCAVDREVFHPDYDSAEIRRVADKYGIEGSYILYLGTLEPRKNITQLIEAYKLLRERTAEKPKLVIAGKKGWSFDNIFELVQRYQLKEEVIFTGYVPDEEIPYLLSGALCFVFPSLYEGFGMPPLEAMACGVPVISSNAASIPEVVGDAGILVHPKETEELYQAMFDIVTDDEKRNRLIEKGLKRSRQFSWEASAIKLRKVYQEMAGEKR